MAPRFSITLGLTLIAVLSASVQAQLTTLSGFNPSKAGDLCGIGFDQTTGHVWVYDCFANTIQEYSSTGEFLSEITRPGESANDVDIDFAPEAFTLGTTDIDAGTLLFINGESGAAEIYAVDKDTGSILATLNTTFGSSHVVGGSYHPGRDTFFLVQDKGGGTTANTVAEVDPQTGEVLNTFSTITSGFEVNFGDLDVSTVTGNLFVVSSNETTVAQFTPTGTLLLEFALPAGVNSLSGIAIDDVTGEGWVSENGGDVWRLGGSALIPDCEPDGDVDLEDFAHFQICYTGADGVTPVDCDCSDVDGDGDVDESDYAIFRVVFIGP